MIWITADDKENDYKEPFSKGAISQSLSVLDLSVEKTYDIARDIESYLNENNISEISNSELFEIIINNLKKVDEEQGEKFENLITLRKSQKPLIILIGGASGVGTSSMAFELANRLKLKNIIGTDMVREVMRKMISKELIPTLHKSSFDAHESVKTTSIMLDSAIDGFSSQVETVNVGVEAIIERSVKEGISTIIEGVHIVPGFIRRDLLEDNNIIIFLLTVDDEESHKQRFYTRCSKPWVKRSIDLYMNNFNTIRKTQNFLVRQSKLNDARIINNVDMKETLDIMVTDIIDRFILEK